MYSRSRYSRNHWYMAFFWAFIGFILGQTTPQVSFSIDESQPPTPAPNTRTKGDFN